MMNVRDVLWSLRAISVVILLLTTVANTGQAKGPPRVTSRVNWQQVVKEGQQLRLACPVEAEPSPLMEWTKDDELVTEAWERYRMTSRGLRIKDARPDDDGFFRCTATNGFGSVSVDYRVWVMPDNNDTSWTPPPMDYEDYEGLGEPPMWSRPEQMRPADLMRPAGSSLRLRCKASGKPKPAIVWFKDNMPINPETPAELEAEWDEDYEDGEGTIAESRWTLRLTNLQSDHSGRYTCKVFNTAGAINYTYTVEVIDRLSAPVITDPYPVNSTVETGASTSFQCTVHSDVQPTIQWLKRVEHGSGSHHTNATITVKGQKFVVLKTGKVWSRKDGSYLNKLTISHVTPQHAGMYICLGANSMGYSFKSAYLTVLSLKEDAVREPILSLPIIIAIPAAVLVILVVVTVVIVVRRQRQQKQKTLIRTRVPPPMSPQSDKHGDQQQYSALQAYHVVQRAPSHERIIKNYSDIHSDVSQQTPPHHHHPYPYQHQYPPHKMMNGHAQAMPVPIPQVPPMHNMPPIQPPPPLQTFPYHNHTNHNHMHYAPC